MQTLIDEESVLYFTCLSFIALEDSTKSIESEISSKEFAKIVVAKATVKNDRLAKEVLNFVRVLKEVFPKKSSSLVSLVESTGLVLPVIYA